MFSMVSTEVFQWLLKNLIEGARLRKIVLLGDHLQLPSVDPGNFMEDLFLALGPRGMTVTLKTNHRSEGNLIFDNATRISRQQMPVFDSSGEFCLILPGKENTNKLPGQVRSHAVKLPPSTSRPIEVQRSKRKGRDITLEKVDLYWSLIKDHRREYVIDNDETSQIISFLNVECDTLNQFGCFIYNKHLTWEISAKNGKQVKQFHVGDKIMCLKNNDVGIIVPEDKEDCLNQTTEDVTSLVYTNATDGKFEEDPNIKLKFKTERLMNGNLYKIRAICRADVKSSGTADDTSGDTDSVSAPEGVKVNMEYHVLDDLAGEIIRVNLNQLIKKTKISHAWALSIHKFQGSESGTIVYGLSGSNHESWKHVYTAVTRGRKKVVIVGSYTDLENAVKRKPIKRQTALGEKVRSLMSQVEREKQRAAQREDRDSEMKETPTLVEEKTLVKVAEPVTPNKLSRQLSETLNWGDEEEFDNLPFDSIEAGQTVSSPSKRKAVQFTSVTSPPKLFKVGNPIMKSLTEVDNFSGHKGGGSKRLAFDSPASYQKSLSVSSPLTYGDRTAKHKTKAADSFSMNESFGDIDCSLIEREAIASSQTITQRNLAEVFGNEEESFGDLTDDFTDDELAEAVR